MKKKRRGDGEAAIVEEDEVPILQAGEAKHYLRLTPHDVIDMTVVGNTAMHHILLKIDPQFVGLAPFPPVVHKSLDIKARDLGIGICDSAYIHVLPIVAGFVGADNVGVLIAEEPYKKDEVQLIIDIGTNGELVLGNKEKLISSSCATGPALEGAQIAFGMRAAPGAVERIKIDPGTHEVDYKVIGRDAWKSFSKPEEMKTKGICGSGILDVLAELYTAGIVLKAAGSTLSKNPLDTGLILKTNNRSSSSLGKMNLLSAKTLSFPKKTFARFNWPKARCTVVASS